jgi:hypothetical protein
MVPTCILAKIFDHLLYLDDQETIQNILKISPLFSQHLPKGLTTLCFPLGYYQLQVNSDWSRIFIFFKHKNILIDYLHNRKEGLPEWLFNIREVREMIPHCAGFLGIGRYQRVNGQNVFVCKMRYGKSYTLAFQLELVTRRKLIMSSRSAEFTFIELDNQV